MLLVQSNFSYCNLYNFFYFIQISANGLTPYQMPQTKKLRSFGKKSAKSFLRLIELMMGPGEKKLSFGAWHRPTTSIKILNILTQSLFLSLSCTHTHTHIHTLIYTTYLSNYLIKPYSNSLPNKSFYSQNLYTSL